MQQTDESSFRIKIKPLENISPYVMPTPVEIDSCVAGKAGKKFFSEEKNQKTFIPALISAGALPTGTHGDITGGQKFFGSFFQKRTPSFLPV